jgi:hypothetical protein
LPDKWDPWSRCLAWINILTVPLFFVKVDITQVPSIKVV